MALAKWREELGIEKWNDEEAKGKMASGEELLGEVKKGGWFSASDEEGGVTKHRLSRGVKESLKTKEGKKKVKTCEGSGAEFPKKCRCVDMWREVFAR